VRDQQIVQKVIDRISMENKVKISRGPTLLSNSIGGVTISSADGFVTFDNTYEARLERVKPALRKQIAKLFEDPSASSKV